jgi:hypothetical protein
MLFWLNTFILSSRNDPPRFVEFVMAQCAIAALTASIIFPQDKPYFVLCLSLVFGLSISILVREAMPSASFANAPSHQTRVSQIAAIVLLLTSLFGFADFLQTL